MARKLFIGTIRLPDGREFPFRIRAKNKPHVKKTLNKITPPYTVLVELVGIKGSEDRRYKREAKEVERLTKQQRG